MVTVFFTLYYKYLDAIEYVPVPVWYNITLPFYSLKPLDLMVHYYFPAKSSYSTQLSKAFEWQNIRKLIGQNLFGKDNNPKLFGL